MKRFSIHIGINRVNPTHYGNSFPALRGAVNDATALQQALQPMGYAEQVTLLDQNATTDKVGTQLNRFADRMVAGDLLVLTYSGHGSQIIDLNSVEPDNLNEVFVFWNRFLVDDELRRLFVRFATGVHIVVISDSCNSGTNFRNSVDEDIPDGMVETQPLLITAEMNRLDLEPGPEEQSRLVSLDVAMQVVGEHADLYGPILQQRPSRESALKATVLALSACQDNQEAFEMADGKNGVFTVQLLKLIKMGLPANYTALRQAIAPLTPRQNPQLGTDGPNATALVNRKPFV